MEISLYYFCVCVCLCECICTMCACSTFGGQERVLDILELKLQVVVLSYMGAEN